MTPKQKAEELIEKFDECLNHIACGSNGIEDHLHDRAKQCALIAVDETLIVLQNPVGIAHIETESYWQSVKSELEKM